jgi:hypothetical protein
MLAQILNRDFIVQSVDPIREALEALQTGALERPVDAPEVTAAELKEAATALRAVAADLPRDSHADQAGAAIRRADVAPIDDYAYIPSDALISVVQSTLEEAFREREVAPERRAVRNDTASDDDLPPPVTDEYIGDAPPGPTQTVDGTRRLGGKFEVPSDIGWVSCKIAEAIRHFRHRAPFIDQPQTRAIGKRVRLVVVGDWGTGIPRARRVAAAMRTILLEGLDRGLEQHAVHLGDVYYSGFEYEYNKRFLANWPVRVPEADAVSSWTIPGNHDLYSGGYGYYKALTDPRFAGHCGCSYFLLENDDWRIIGLDTGWEDGGLAGDQPAWLESVLASGERKRTMLLTHHQGVSVYKKAPERLHERIAHILARHPVDVWLWGHEHRCMAFDATDGIGAAACLGHGGVPEYQWHMPDDPVPAPGRWEYRDVFPKSYGFEPWGVFGFAVVEIDGATARISYLNEFGNPAHDPEVL